MTELVIVRHAQSVWNADGRWQGWADPPLSALGEWQAAEAGRALAGRVRARPADAPVLIAASDLRRARQTAEALAAALRDGTPRDGTRQIAEPRAYDRIVIDPDLREYDTGEWTGLQRAEIVERWPEELAAWDAGRLEATPGGEDRAAFVARLFAALQRLHQHDPAGPQNAGPQNAGPQNAGPVLVVCHGRAIHAIIDALGGHAGHIDHLTGWRLHLGGAPVLVGPVTLLQSASLGEAVPEPVSEI